MRNRSRVSSTKIAKSQRTTDPNDMDQDPTTDTFPMIGLPDDISRTDWAVRAALESAFKLMIHSFEQAANGNAEARRGNALAIAALCVGGMVLSRSIDDRKLADELRGAAKATALDLAKW